MKPLNLLDRYWRKMKSKKVFVIKCVALIMFTFLLNHSLFSQGKTLHVQITNIRDAEGNIAIALYNSEKDFMKTRYQSKLVKAVKGTVTIQFENVPQGEYAISTLHDLNGDLKMETNLIGIPTEGFGFSNDAMGTMGPPSFEKAKFSLSQKPVVITMKYY